jgi:hypothetical protein
MPRARLQTTAAAALGATLVVLAAGCGSQTKTVSVGGASPPPATETLATATQGTSAASTTPAPSSQSQPGGSAPQTTTRSAPEPAFTEGTQQGGVATAVAVLHAHGDVPEEPAQYHSNQTLQVLVGRPAQSGDGYGQQAFFFVDGRYIGTDAREPSATVRVVSQADTEVALAYPLYHRSDPLCCPSGGHTTVRFQLDNGRLVPLGAIPPTSRSAGLSRY